MACLLGAARVLSQMADEIPGKIKFVWQPAEEGYGGGKVMIEEGILESPKVDAAFALHGWPYLPLGVVGVHGGTGTEAIKDALIDRALARGFVYCGRSENGQ